jgi:hypothetical protein
VSTTHTTVGTTIPLWWWGGNPDSIDYMDHPGVRCREHGDLFFREDAEAVPMCRTICYQCPVRKDCARYAIRHYDDVPHGNWAGYSATERKKISEGRIPFYDWAKTWSQTTRIKMLVNARALNNRKKGLSKRRLNRLAIPDCPLGHVNVRRSGRQDGRQLYRCRECGLGFLGEEL